MNIPCRALLPVPLLALALATMGCQSYQLEGRVIEGAQSAIFIVDQEDPRLNEPGLAQADLTLTLDPRRVTAEQLGAQRSASDGSFSFDVNEFGAGFLEHDVRLQAEASGYHETLRDFQLPSRNKAVLVVLRPESAGRSPQQEAEDPTQGRDDPRGRELLDETLEWGEPYMR